MLSIEDMDPQVILIKLFPFVCRTVSLKCQAGDIFYLPKKTNSDVMLRLRDTLMAIDI